MDATVLLFIAVSQLSSFHHYVTDGARRLRRWLPIRRDVPDEEVFRRFLLPPSLWAHSRTLPADAGHPNVAVLQAAERRLARIEEVVDTEYSFSMKGQLVPITLTLDLKGSLDSLLGDLRGDLVWSVADSDVTALYDPASLAPGMAHILDPVIMGPGDKNIDGLAQVVRAAEQRGVTWSSVLIAFGGGSVGNTAGTAAGLICRGTRLIHVPTTLVAQLDSAIGGKQSVNGGVGKNYLGLFHAPIKVFVQPLFLLSLDYNRISDGLVEAMKHGFCQEHDLVRQVLEYATRKDEAPFDLLVHILKRTIELKLEYLVDDPLENDPRTHLELGHKLGHAVEFLAGGRLSHGQSVAFGMLAEGLLFTNLGKTNAATFDYLRNSVVRLISPTEALESIRPARVAEQLWRDNKRSGDCVPFSYLVEPQHPRSCVQPLDERFLDQVVSAVRDAKALLGCGPEPVADPTAPRSRRATAATAGSASSPR